MSHCARSPDPLYSLAPTKVGFIMADFFKAQPHMASFALKEGASIKSNKLDYSLLFLHTSPREALVAPLEPEQKKLRNVPLFFKLQSPILSREAPAQATPATIVSK